MANEIVDTQTFEINAPGAQEAKFRELLNRPEIYAKVMEMATGLDKVISQTATMMGSIGLGARFQDKKSKSVFEYVSLVQPFKPDMLTQLVLDVAKYPWTQYQQPAFMIMREHVMNPQDGKTLMTRDTMLSARDFVKIVATGRWEIIDYGQSTGQHADLQDIILS